MVNLTPNQRKRIKTIADLLKVSPNGVTISGIQRELGLVSTKAQWYIDHALQILPVVHRDDKVHWVGDLDVTVLDDTVEIETLSETEIMRLKIITRLLKRYHNGATVKEVARDLCWGYTVANQYLKLSAKVYPVEKEDNRYFWVGQSVEKEDALSRWSSDYAPLKTRRVDRLLRRRDTNGIGGSWVELPKGVVKRG